MANDTTTQFDRATFDTDDYGFDIDRQKYVPMVGNSQVLERAQGQRLVRTSA